MSTKEEHSDDIALAGEYALRLLDDAERLAFEERMLNDPTLRDLVRDWDEQLAVLAQDVEPVAPPAAVKARLHNSLFPDVQPRRSPFWTWMTGGLIAAGLVIGAVFLVPLLTPVDAPAVTFTANVAADDGSLVVMASYFAETNTLEVLRQTGAAVPGRALELWLIAEGADAPVSLGVLPDDQDARIEISEALAQQMAGAVLAISDEPLGGSATGAPTGAVLAVGQVTGA